MSTDINDFVHTGPGTLAGLFFRKFWLAIYKCSDLKPEWSVPVKILSEKLTLFRGASGRVFLVGNRCAHRGTQLSTGIVEGDAIQCIYHGWKFNGSGQCIDQPSEPCSFAESVRIKAYPCIEYLGLIFAYMGEGEPPPAPRFPHFEDDDGVMFSHQLVRPINFFQNLENSIDEVHIGFLHANSPYEGNINEEVPLISTFETDFGLAQCGERKGGLTRNTYYQPPTTTSWAQAPTYPEETGWRSMLGFRVPIDDENHITHTVTFAKVPYGSRDAFFARRHEEWEELSKLPSAEEIADAVLAGRMRFKDIPYRGKGADMTRIQDRIALMGQGVIADRARENLGQADVAIKLLRGVWQREMAAIRDGKPTKNWTNEMPPPTSGVDG